jgi:hypothetical protein
MLVYGSLVLTWRSAIEWKARRLTMIADMRRRPAIADLRREQAPIEPIYFFSSIELPCALITGRILSVSEASAHGSIISKRT